MACQAHIPGGAKNSGAWDVPDGKSEYAGIVAFEHPCRNTDSRNLDLSDGNHPGRHVRQHRSCTVWLL
jgi:hypothetical protein